MREGPQLGGLLLPFNCLDVYLMWILVTEALLTATWKNPRKRSVCEGFVLAPEEGFEPPT